MRLGEVEDLTRRALDWLLTVARPTDTGLAWPAAPSDPEPDWSLYQGTAGVVAALLDGHRHFGIDAYAEAALRGAHATIATLPDTEDSSLYVGVAGTAVMAKAVAETLGDKDCHRAVEQALDLLRTRFDGRRWGTYFELLLGNAGIALAALRCGDTELAQRALEPYLDAADETEAGVNWHTTSPESESRYHHFSHGSTGIAYALAAVARAANRPDFLALARRALADVIARDTDGPAGFLAPHSDPQAYPDRVQRFCYGWCHGPTGDAQAFRILAAVTGEPPWTELVERCWHTVSHSGIPRRRHPGFWDNNGCCCGTAGVLTLACDRHVDTGADLDFAEILVADLVSRATVDSEGARWSNVEHRQDPSILEPRTGWAMGTAGIARELLRYVRIREGRDFGYVLDFPDHFTPTPAA